MLANENEIIKLKILLSTTREKQFLNIKVNQLSAVCTSTHKQLIS